MKCPPEIGPNIKMMAKRPVAVAAAFSKSSSPMLPGDRFCAAMPEPMTMAARKALPRNSASRRRHRTVSLTDLSPDRPRSLSSRTSRPGSRRRHGDARDGLGDAAGPVAGDAGLGRGVGEDGVDLPGRTVGVADPDLVLDGVATGRLLLDLGLEPRFVQASRCRRHLVGRLDLHTQVVEGADRPVTPGGGVLHQDELERRVGDGEVGVARLALGRLGPEELGVELDRLVDVADVQCELDPRHGDLPVVSISVDASSMADTLIDVNISLER